jgi:four helix bundle protein
MRVWIRAIDLYVLLVAKVKEIPGHPYGLQNQITCAGASVHSNIAEGYCRKSLREYLHFLNVALASCGEVYSRSYACAAAGQFSAATFEEIDSLHYEVENLLLGLIESLQKKELDGDWEDNLAASRGEKGAPQTPGATSSNLPTFQPSSRPPNRDTT